MESLMNQRQGPVREPEERSPNDCPCSHSCRDERQVGMRHAASASEGTCRGQGTTYKCQLTSIP